MSNPPLRAKFVERIPLPPVRGDVDRIRIICAFASADLPHSALARAVCSGTVSLAYHDQLHPIFG